MVEKLKLDLEPTIREIMEIKEREKEVFSFKSFSYLLFFFKCLIDDPAFSAHETQSILPSKCDLLHRS